jgi:hypothetical protein
MHSVPTPHSLVFVSGGPGRLIDVLLAVALGLYVWRKPQTPIGFLWLIAAVLASRCVFEAVMTPYYIAPALVFGLVVAARRGSVNLLVATAIAIATTIFSYFHFGPWIWWTPIVTGLALILALGFPVGGIGQPSREEGPSAVADETLGRGSDDPLTQSASGRSVPMGTQRPLQRPDRVLSPG